MEYDWRWQQMKREQQRRIEKKESINFRSIRGIRKRCKKMRVPVRLVAWKDQRATDDSLFAGVLRLHLRAADDILQWLKIVKGNGLVVCCRNGMLYYNTREAYDEVLKSRSLDFGLRLYDRYLHAMDIVNAAGAIRGVRQTSAEK